MTPSVISGAMTGSEARKMQAKLARGSSIIMQCPPKEFSESSAAWDLPKPLINDRRNGANIPEAALESAWCELCVEIPSHRQVP